MRLNLLGIWIYKPVARALTCPLCLALLTLLPGLKHAPRGPEPERSERSRAIRLVSLRLRGAVFET